MFLLTAFCHEPIIGFMITKKLDSRTDFHLQNDFITTELSLVAALMLWGFPIDTLDKTNPSRITFSFKRSDGLDIAIQAFWSNSATIYPKDYFQVLRELKSRIRER